MCLYGRLLIGSFGNFEHGVILLERSPFLQLVVDSFCQVVFLYTLVYSFIFLNESMVFYQKKKKKLKKLNHNFYWEGNNNIFFNKKLSFHKKRKNERMY